VTSAKNHRIEPAPSVPIALSEIPSLASGWPDDELGCWIGAAIVFGWIVLSVFMASAGVVVLNAFGNARGSQYEGPLIILALVLLGTLIVATIVLYLKQVQSRRVNEIENYHLWFLQQDAARLTTSTAQLLASSETKAHRLPLLIDRALGHLQQAQQEYEEKAYGPFWDAVEGAARCLGEYQIELELLAASSTRYYESLKERTHSFPDFCVTYNGIPSPSPALNDLRRVVRLGQTNFEFATIWEHRRTREVLIAGFRTLEAAVTNVGSRIEDSLGTLRVALSSDLAQVVSSQILMRDSGATHAATAGEKLDRIGDLLDRRQ
jgi:hypothetical protein